ncbi:MAG: sulfatase-like hydrolase/transferase, partial [Pirellulales bacterium]
MLHRLLPLLAQSALFIFTLFFVGTARAAEREAAERPNVLWLSVEDMSAHLGCYDDEFAHTPVLDKLAERGNRYSRCFATIGVCAPARSTIISGMYPPSIGTQYMRCNGNVPNFMQGFPAYLREKGYYCTNNSKTDYNFKVPGKPWDESSGKAHYKNRKQNQPFFAVFNFTGTHESRIRQGAPGHAVATRRLTDEQRQNAATIPIPPYHPATPEVRQDWAKMYELVTGMDYWVADKLKELEEAGLADDTIVIFWSDHGTGMPRSKRWLYESGTHVPYIAYFPEKYRHLAPGEPGEVIDRLVSFVDFAPTTLSLAGVEIPKHMQGVAFHGKQAGEPREYVHGFRDRMDERIDMLRSVRDKQYRYIRNFMPHLEYGQHISYMFEMPTTRIWAQMAAAGELNEVQARFFTAPKPVEELYDVEADPHEINNLAEDPAHAETLQRMRGELKRWMLDIRDIGLLPEAEVRRRFAEQPPYTAVRENPALLPTEELFDAAVRCVRADASEKDLLAACAAEEAGVRYWALMGMNLQAAGDQLDRQEVVKTVTQLAESDPCPAVRVAAAEVLCQIGETETALPVLAEAMRNKNGWLRLQAINVIDRLDGDAASIKDSLKTKPSSDGQADGYVDRVR